LFGQEISLPWACVKPLDNFLLDARVFLPVVESALAMTDHSQLSSCATFGYVVRIHSATGNTTGFLKVIYLGGTALFSI
jgi:hypothetical protein